MSQPNKQQFHFSIGPVQQFIGQARRTRDFWAGSFLLSWLSGVAMLAAKKQQGTTIIFPKPEQSYLDWLTGNGEGDAPLQGSIPNRFMATVDVATFDGAKVEQEVKQAWVALADLVWQHDFEKSSLTAAQKAAAKAIWQRQHQHCWEIIWVVADEGLSNALDLRKNWRNFMPTTEPGQKCHLMDGWQELSGVPGVRGTEQKDRKAFWSALMDGKEESDFSDTEHLCAIAYVRGRFIRFFHQFKVSVKLSEQTEKNVSLLLKGWKLPANRPSVVYMAAVHWLDDLLKQSMAQDKLAELMVLNKLALKLFKQDETKSAIACLDETAKKLNEASDSRLGSQLVSFNGMLFFEDMCLLEASNPKLAVEFCAKLKDLCKAVDMPAVSPTPFYAVLTMDGDRLGIHMGDKTKRGSIAAALNAFTTQVSETVAQHNGSLVYAGGDDVMAILPLENALLCAEQLKEDYLEAFKQYPTQSGEVIGSTLSGAIIYAHVKSPLTEVLRQSHQLLDHVAKEALGRNALAIRVLKPGGVSLTWGQPWDKAPIKHLAAIVAALEAADEGFSSRFFYGLRSDFDLMRDHDGITRETCLGIIRMHFLASMQGKKAYPEKLQDEALKTERMAWVNQQLAHLFEVIAVNNTFSADALMLVRFLSLKGVEAI